VLAPAEQRPVHGRDPRHRHPRPYQIQFAQTATYGARGLAIAWLAAMKKRGCNIRLVYAMFGRQALQGDAT
jgi:hypothetical protein